MSDSVTFLMSMIKYFHIGCVNICHSPTGRSVLGETVSEVLRTVEGGTETEGKVSPNTD